MTTAGSAQSLRMAPLHHQEAYQRCTTTSTWCYQITVQQFGEKQPSLSEPASWQTFVPLQTMLLTQPTNWRC